MFEASGWTCPSCGCCPDSIAGFPLFAPKLTENREGYREEFYAELASLEHGNFWFEARNALILWVLRRYFPAPGRLLEIGCGTGFVLSALCRNFPEAELMGSEVLPAGLSFAKQRVPNVQLLQMDARDIPFSDHFDLIGAFDVLEHIPEDGKVLEQIHSALRPGGGLLVTVPQHPWLWGRQDEHACHVRRYTASGLRQAVQQAGFVVLYETSFVSLLIPLMLLSRLRMNWSAPNTDALSELRLSRSGNALLGTVMTIERMLIKSKIRFDFGGSRLLLAQRL